MCDIKDDEPTFCKILDIVEKPASETLFIARILATICFNRHHHSYEVAPMANTAVYRHNEFSDHHPLHQCKSYGTNRSHFIRLKYICSKWILSLRWGALIRISPLPLNQKSRNGNQRLIQLTVLPGSLHDGSYLSRRHGPHSAYMTVTIVA